MDLDKIRQTLYSAAKLRAPRFESETPTVSRVSALEDYLLDVAITRGALEEARLYMHDALHLKLCEWDDLEGWEALAGDARNRTQETVRLAKKSLDPELHSAVREGKHIVARLSDQIRRLEHDEDVASRTYTLIAGS